MTWGSKPYGIGRSAASRDGAGEIAIPATHRGARYDQTADHVHAWLPVWNGMGMVLGLYVGFSRLNHLQSLERELMLTGILEVVKLPPQCTFWRFLASLHLTMARQLLEVGRRMRQRV